MRKQFYRVPEISLQKTINEDAKVRTKMRKLFEDTATFQCKVVEDKKEAAAKYKDYFDFSEPIRKIPSHRILAVFAGFSGRLSSNVYRSK